jgi:hypothetical protein
VKSRSLLQRDTVARSALAAAGIAIGAAHGPLIGYGKLANVDEAYAVSLAQRLLEGQKLYQGAISQRGPLMYYTYELIAYLGGWDNVRALRVSALAFSLAQLLAIYSLAKSIFGAAEATVTALVVGYALSAGIPDYDRFALNGELLQVPLLILSCWLVMLALRESPTAQRGSPRLVHFGRLFSAGMALGCAVSIKQTVLVHALPVVIWIIARCLHGRVRAGAAIGELGGFMLGLGLPVAGFLLHASHNGTLTDLYYYTVRYNLVVHVGGATNSALALSPLTRELRANTLFSISILFLLGHLIPRIAAALSPLKRWSPSASIFDEDVFLWLQWLVALVSAVSLQRFFAHYFIPVIPFIGILLGRILRGPLERIAPCLYTRFAGGGGVTLLAVAAVETYQLEKIDGRVAHGREVERLSRYVEATTTPEDRVFVWGFSPWVYVYSHRRAAGRYVFGTYLTGLVPWFHQSLSLEKSRIVPGSVDALLGDLDRETPEIVVDAGSVMLARSMRTYDAPAAWLHRNYCFEVRIPGFDVYRRKKLSHKCDTDVFPVVQGAYDFYGRKIDVSVPKTVDAESSGLLNQGDPALPSTSKEVPWRTEMKLLREPTDLQPGMRIGQDTDTEQ